MKFYLLRPFFAPLFTALFLLSAQLLSAQFAEANEETIKVVSSFPLTGSSNGQSTSIINGIKMAFEEAQWRAGGFKIVYESWDDASPERGTWDPALEAANAERAIADPDTVIYIGPYNSGAARISIPRLNKAGLSIINGFSSWPGLSKAGFGEPNEPAVYRPSGKINFFRIIPTDEIQGAVGALWSRDMGVKQVFILHDRELYGKGVAEMFRRQIEKLGIKILGFEGIDAKASNYKVIATKIRQLNPDLVYFGGLTQTNGGQLAKDLRSSGVRAKLMVPDGCYETAFLDSAGRQNLEGLTYVTFGGVPPANLEGRGKIFVEEYKKRFGIEPEALAAYGFEAAKVALQAINTAKKKDREAIREAIAGIRNFDGFLGKWSFDDQGNSNLTTMSGNVVRGGKFEFDRFLTLPD